jgi:hypothetical protein
MASMRNTLIFSALAAFAAAAIAAIPAGAAAPPKPVSKSGQVELKGLELMVVDDHGGSSTVVNR